MGYVQDKKSSYDRVNKSLKAFTENGDISDFKKSQDEMSRIVTRFLISTEDVSDYVEKTHDMLNAISNNFKDTGDIGVFNKAFFVSEAFSRLIDDKGREPEYRDYTINNHFKLIDNALAFARTNNSDVSYINSIFQTLKKSEFNTHSEMPNQDTPQVREMKFIINLPIMCIVNSTDDLSDDKLQKANEICDYISSVQSTRIVGDEETWNIKPLIAFTYLEMAIRLNGNELSNTYINNSISILKDVVTNSKSEKVRNSAIQGLENIAGKFEINDGNAKLVVLGWLHNNCTSEGDKDIRARIGNKLSNAIASIPNKYGESNNLIREQLTNIYNQSKDLGALAIDQMSEVICKGAHDGGNDDIKGLAGCFAKANMSRVNYLERVLAHSTATNTVINERQMTEKDFCKIVSNTRVEPA